MKISRRTNMVKWLKKAERKAKRTTLPPDGSAITLFYGDLDKNGRGHYQIELIHDTRFSPNTWVDVFWWPNRWARPGASSADYHLTNTAL